jgi:D-lactate dehydrogenase
MKVAVFSAKDHDRRSIEAANSTHHHELIFFEAQLNRNTALLAKDIPVVCPFVNDEADGDLDLAVVRVPAYSPYAVAEHTVALILMLNRKLYRAYNRVRDDNFSLEGLLGFDLHGCTIGIIGTGKIGMVFAQIMQGFGCSLLGYDKFPNPQFEAFVGARYVELPELLAKSDVISLHCPLTPENHYLINPESIAQMKPGVMLINTSRGGLVDTKAVIAGIKSAQIGYLGIDVYEQEADLFAADLSSAIVQDDDFQLLKSFPNVVITAHQAFFTQNALQAIAETTLSNITEFEQGQNLTNQVK